MNHYSIREAENGWTVEMNPELGHRSGGFLFVFESAYDLATFLRKQKNRSKALNRPVKS